MILRRFVPVLLLCWALSACAIAPVQHAGTPGLRCTDPRFAYRLALDPAETAESLAPSPFDAALEQAYRSGNAKALRDEKPVSNSMLLLSGGSEDGAFGAGFLSQWASQRRHGLPRVRVVTGISTGSLQSSFAFIDEPQVNVDSYSITREGELLRPLVSRGLDEHPVRGAMALARKGTLATLDPLRSLLHRLLTDSRLRAIAREADPDGPARKLLVGAVDMDSGDLLVFDLGKYAGEWVAATDRHDAPAATAFKDCYVEALLASSSVPMAAPPVFIDGQVFIDGGARFGVFLERLDKVLARHARSDRQGRPVDSLFILVNGTLRVSPQCTLGACPNPAPKWRFDALAFRSLSVLINQSYVASVAWAQALGQSHGYTPRIARMETGPGGFTDHRAATGLPTTGDPVKTCAEWKAEDNVRDHPLEFHPRFMRCLIDYGRHHRAVAPWAAAE